MIDKINELIESLIIINTWIQETICDKVLYINLVVPR